MRSIPLRRGTLPHRPLAPLPVPPSCLLRTYDVQRTEQQEMKNDSEMNDTMKRFEDGYGNDLRVFDIDCLKGIERVEIGNDCFENVNRFVIDGLNELKGIIIRKSSFELDEKSRKGSKCVIMNCDQLSEIHIGTKSFYWYESLELKNLPSMIWIQLDVDAFMKCRSVVFESMNDWLNNEWDLNQLESIILGFQALFGDVSNREWNELIMKGMNDTDDWLMRSPFSIYNRRRKQLRKYRQGNFREWWLMIEFELDIPSVSEDRIKLIGPFGCTRELSCTGRID